MQNHAMVIRLKLKFLLKNLIKSSNLRWLVLSGPLPGYALCKYSSQLCFSSIGKKYPRHALSGVDNYHSKLHALHLYRSAPVKLFEPNLKYIISISGLLECDSIEPIKLKFDNNFCCNLSKFSCDEKALARIDEQELQCPLSFIDLKSV